MNEVTPGWKTSEFWLHLLANVPAVLVLVPGLPSSAVIAITAISHLSALFYGSNRAALKTKALDITAAALDAAAAKAAQ